MHASTRAVGAIAATAACAFALPAFVLPAVMVGRRAEAQPMGMAMPDPRAMSGKPLPDGNLARGTVTVRVARKTPANAVVDADVTAIVEGPGGEARKRSARTDKTGRATFESLPAGHQFRAEVSVDGEHLTTESFPVPQTGGVRTMLIAGLGAIEPGPGKQEHGNEAANPEAHPPAEGGEPGAEAGNDQFAMGAIAGIARPEPKLPTGTVEVRALDEAGKPLASKKIFLGQVGTDGKLAVKKAETSTDGVARFEGLGGGGGAAVVMQHAGMRIGSDAFAFPAQGGVSVEIRALERTPDPSVITIGEGARIIVQLREDGVGFVEMLPLENRSNKIFDPSPGSLEIPLPRDFHGAEVGEGSHKMEVRKGFGIAVAGAIGPSSRFRAPDRAPPDEVRFGFFLPSTGSTRTFEQPMPNGMAEFTFATEQIEGLTVESDQISGRQEREANGKRYWLMRGAAIPPGGTLRFTLRGLPAPDETGRNVAGLLALGLMVAAVVLGRRPGKPEHRAARSKKDDLIERREKLFAELIAVEARRRGSAGSGAGAGTDAGHTGDLSARAELMRKLENIYRELATLDERPQAA